MNHAGFTRISNTFVSLRLSVSASPRDKTILSV